MSVTVRVGLAPYGDASWPVQWQPMVEDRSDLGRHYHNRSSEWWFAKQARLNTDFTD